MIPLEQFWRFGSLRRKIRLRKKLRLPESNGFWDCKIPTAEFQHSAVVGAHYHLTTARRILLLTRFARGMRGAANCRPPPWESGSRVRRGRPGDFWVRCNGKMVHGFHFGSVTNSHPMRKILLTEQAEWCWR